MSSRFRASLLILGVAAWALAACDREERHSRSKPIGETVPAGQSPDTIWPGGTSGEVGNPGYTRFLERWLTNETLRLHLDTVEGSREAISTQTFAPSNP